MIYHIDFSTETVKVRQRNQKTSIVEKSKLLDFSTILCFVFQNML